MSSQELIVLFIADRRSRDRKSRDRKSHFSFNHCMLLMRRCDMRCRISAVGDSLGFSFKSVFNICDAMDFASLLCSLFMHMGKCFTLSSRCDIAFRELNTKILIKIFCGFFVKGPPLLDVIDNTKQRGGLLVTTTMAIHCEEPVISAFLLTFHFRNRKIFICLKFVMDR